MNAQTFLLTLMAMLAFAANSVLGRLGLVDGEAGAGGFALIRLLSGGLMLALILLWQQKRPAGSWRGGVSLALYAGAFSYAYLALPAGTGAIILFATVQLTMLGAGFISGERLVTGQWLGFMAAIAGLIWLLAPGLEAPPPGAALLMMLSGVGWGAYSLLGRSAGDPGAMTAGNFIRASLIAAVASIPLLLAMPEAIPSRRGMLLAAASGALTSGLGYMIWYAALKGLTATRAGIAQLTVPAFAAIGGVIWLSEPITMRFALASLVILGGVAIAVLTGAARSPKAHS